MSWFKKWGKVILGGIETALDVGCDLIPGGGAIKKGKKHLKKWAKLGKFGTKAAKIGVGTYKDFLDGGEFPDFEGLSKNFDDKVRKGQEEAKKALEEQGQALRGEMGELKSELEGQLKQQGEKLENEIKDLDKRMAEATGANKKAIEEEKKQRQAQYQKLQSAINEVTENLNRVEAKLTDALNDFKNEVNERFEQVEQKILENKRKIEEERIKREEEIREVKDNIKLTNTNVENLRKEKEQLEDEFITYKSQINQQTAETQQAFEDSQAEYERRAKIIETQIEDNQETIEEFNEQLTNVQNEQARQKLEQEEIFENLQEQSDILHFQKHKIEMVANQMEEIHEEVHDRMDKLSQKLNERTNETLNIAKETNQKVDKLTEDVKNIKETTEQLQEQVEKNKQETEKAKKEAKLANERLDSLLKTQALSDFSAETSKLDKIKKSLELKAEETKLLATLNLLQETKKMVQVELSEINWQVGTKEGTEKDIPREEGYLLNPNSSWAKQYTPEQLREWGWDTRLLNDNEQAPLTDEEKRNPKQAQENEQNTKAAGEESTQAQEAFEKIEELKAEALTRLQEIQQEIRTGLEEIESSPTPPPPPNSAKAKTQTIQEEIKQKKQTLTQKEQKTQNLARKPHSAKNQKQLKQAQKEQAKAEQELEQAQSQLSEPSLQLEQEIEKYEEQQAEREQEEVTQQWQTIQALSKQALQEQPEEEEEEKEQKEHDVQKPLEELVQQLKEMEQTQAASQKTMTYAMLFLIIFLMEYIVYKRNGLPGLVVLNIILLICYWYKDQLMEYADLWGKYLLILGYVMGNVLAYSAPEQEKYKWPCVIGFNVAIGLIYGYTLYQKKKEEVEREAFLKKQSKEICQTLNISEEQWEVMNQMTSEQFSELTGWNISNPFSGDIPTSQKAEHFSQLVNQQLQEQEAIAKKEQEIQQQAETLQKAAEIEKNLQKASEGLGSPRMTWTRIKEIYPEFESKSVLLDEIQKANKLLANSTESGQFLTNKLERLPVPNEEEQTLLSNLNLTIEQYIAISLKTPYLTKEEEEFIIDNYLTFNLQAKLQLLSSGLNNLGIDTYEKKKTFIQLNNSLCQEQQLFGLSTKEKENILRFLMNTLNLTEEQRNSLENMGIKPYNATEWEVTEEQKQHLLDFGCNKLKLTEEQAEQLKEVHPDSFKTFVLTGQQKNILNSLAPLTREDKYSEKSLNLLKSLNLKPANQTFLVQEEIIPDPHNSFGKSKSSYLPLKEKFLQGEQRIIRVKEETRQKKLAEEKIKEDKLSILHSLWKVANGGYILWSLSYDLDEWVADKYLSDWQRDILLTCGFKTVPKYNFFELLIFCVENFAKTSWPEFLQGNQDLAEEFEKYSESLRNKPMTIDETIWERFVSSQSSGQREMVKSLNLKELVQEQINQALGNWRPTEELTKETPEENISEEPPREQARPQSSSSTSRYDNLFANLNKEEAERQRKKLEREEANRRLQEQERQRREQKLSEKDRKLKEDEERRTRERELAELEEKKRREAEQARAESLQKQQAAAFQKKQANIDEAKKRAEENLANQIKKNELEEKRKKDEIEKMEKENQAEQERLANQAKLIEEEKQKKLAAIALEDKEERQRIEKRANEEKAKIEADMNEKKRKNDEEVAKQKNQLLKEKSEKEVEIKKLRDEAELQRTLGEENKRLAREQERILREAKGHQNQLVQFRESLWRAVLDYYWVDSETRAGTRNPQQTGSGHLREWLNRYPNMEFNLNFGDQISEINWSGYRTAMQAFYRTAGNQFVNQTEFKRLLEQKVKSLDFLN